MKEIGDVVLYGGGIVQAESIRVEAKPMPFQCVGLEKTAVVQLDPSAQSKRIYVGNLPLIAEIDGNKLSLSDAAIVGMAAGEKESLEGLYEEEYGIIWIDLSFSCEGEMIPNSSLASITIIGEGKDGQQIAGGGILDTNLKSLDEMCNEVSAEGVVYEIEVADHWINVLSVISIRDGNTGRPIFRGVVINHEEQYG